MNNKSVYDSPSVSTDISRYIITVLVDNEPGVLARVVGMFSGRGYNIDSLNVAEVVANEHLSRITIVTHGTNDVVDLILLIITSKNPGIIHMEDYNVCNDEFLTVN